MRNGGASFTYVHFLGMFRGGFFHNLLPAPARHGGFTRHKHESGFGTCLFASGITGSGATFGPHCPVSCRWIRCTKLRQVCALERMFISLLKRISHTSGSIVMDDDTATSYFSECKQNPMEHSARHPTQESDLHMTYDVTRHLTPGPCRYSKRQLVVIRGVPVQVHCAM